MDKLKQILQGINWDFSDYSSTKYPLDINSIPWYPATFIPPIPKFLIALLTEPGDIVLDPFGGKGTTAVETAKQGRLPIYNDLNPFASEITNAIFFAIRRCIDDPDFLSGEDEKLDRYIVPEDFLETFVLNHGINKDVFDWYSPQTLCELFSIISLMLMEQHDDPELFLIRKLALTSMLKQASSQPGHFTYITDNCKPSKLVYKNAKELYKDRINKVNLSANDLVIQYLLTNPGDSLANVVNRTRITTGDARNLKWIDDKSVNLVVTSPPYLCAQDYIKTMRLTNLFFPDMDGFEEAPKHEIGPRNKRRSKSADTVVTNFYNDLNLVFSEIQRVLVPDGYFCLIIGQGKGRITSEYDTISDLCRDIQENQGLIELYHVQRRISNRAIQVGGVNKEDLIIFQKRK